MSPEPHFALIVEPYSFAGSARPTGWRFCLRIHPSQTESIAATHAKGLSVCTAHGIVFGQRDNIAFDLPEPFNEWLREGHLPYLPADGPIGHLGSCLKPPRLEYIRERWIKPPGQTATDPERRMYEARMRARQNKLMKGDDHV